MRETIDPIAPTSKTSDLEMQTLVFMATSIAIACYNSSLFLYSHVRSQ